MKRTKTTSSVVDTRSIIYEQNLKDSNTGKFTLLNIFKIFVS